ncbi:MAG: hypothetical protein IT442_01460 [Phycisphaeraceae bacterium]|nr:hypothetical protein [Phycisphaeraceae bacterium]
MQGRGPRVISTAAIATVAIAMVLCPAAQASAGALLPWEALGSVGLRAEGGRPLEQWLTNLTEAAKSLTVRQVYGKWTGATGATAGSHDPLKREVWVPAGFVAIERHEALGQEVWSERLLNLPPPGR